MDLCEILVELQKWFFIIFPAKFAVFVNGFQMQNPTYEYSKGDMGT